MKPAEIRALRSRCNATLDEFAARLQVGKRTLQNWEAGRVTPRRLGLLRLIQVQRQVDMPAAAGAEV